VSFEDVEPPLSDEEPVLAELDVLGLERWSVA